MTLHILKKDARRLWPAIVAATALLGTLARMDRWRSDWLISSTEGYLNILIPIAWACLIGLAVEQDAIPGDRQFWITRPFRTRSIFAAKALFAVLFVHVPSLVADCYILAMRGFSPLTYASSLLAKQLVLACALTIPALALASLVRSFSHFVMEVVAVAAIFLVLNGTGWREPIILEPLLDTVRREFLIGIVAVAGVVVLIGQYGGRRVLLSRGIAVGFGVAASLFFAYLLPPSALALRTAVTPGAPKVSMRPDNAPRRPYEIWGGRVQIALPIAFEGVQENDLVRAEPVESEIVTALGGHYREIPRRRFSPSEKPPVYSFAIGWGRRKETDPQWLTYEFERPIFQMFSHVPVTIRGKAALDLYRAGASSWMGPNDRANIGGVGRCVTELIEDHLRDQSHLKVECESPEHGLFPTRVRAWSPETGREWKSALGYTRSGSIGPTVNWLSPLYRDVTFFNVGGGNLYWTNWSISIQEARTVRVEITPVLLVGRTSVEWEFRDIDLTKYMVEPPTRGRAR
jgi:hypothetical protein